MWTCEMYCKSILTSALKSSHTSLHIQSKKHYMCVTVNKTDTKVT